MMEEGTLRLLDDGDGYLLQRIDTNGVITSIALSPSDVMIIGQSGQLFQKRVWTKFYPPGVDISRVFATPVADFDLYKDAVGENILLHLASPNGESLVFEIAPDIAEKLATKLPVLAAELRSAKPTAQ